MSPEAEIDGGDCTMGIERIRHVACQIRRSVSLTSKGHSNSPTSTPIAVDVRLAAC